VVTGTKKRITRLAMLLYNIKFSGCGITIVSQLNLHFICGKSIRSV